jgi:glycosyltransferase involved in cell wall biosynthesis
MTHPRVALLVPCHNAEPYIGDFVANMRRQTRPFDEVLFYDDGSTDNTAKLLGGQTLGKAILGKTNAGPSVGRNILLKESVSDLIHFHDIDDWLEPTFLERALAELTDDTDIVICNIRVIDRDSGASRTIHDYSDLSASDDPTAFFLTHVCYPINGLYRRPILEKVGGFREALSRDEDPDLHIRLAHAGARFKVISEPLAINRFGTGTYSSLSYEACWREHLKALKFYRSELPECYLPLLRRDAGRMASFCAYKDLQLSLDYMDFCRSIDGNIELWQALSPMMKPLVRVLGYKPAFRLRFGRIGRSLRKMYPGRIG